MLKLFKRPTKPTPPATPTNYPSPMSSMKQKPSRLKQAWQLFASSLPYSLPLVIYFFDYWLKKYLAMPTINTMAAYFLSHGFNGFIHDIRTTPETYGLFFLWVVAIPLLLSLGIALLVALLRVILLASGKMAFNMFLPSFLTQSQSFVHGVLKKILPQKIINPAEPIVDIILKRIIDKVIFFIKWLVIIIFIAINGFGLARDIKLKDFWQSSEENQITSQLENSASEGGWKLLRRVIPFLPEKKPATPTTNPDAITSPDTTSPATTDPAPAIIPSTPHTPAPTQ